MDNTTGMQVRDPIAGAYTLLEANFDNPDVCAAAFTLCARCV